MHPKTTPRPPGPNVFIRVAAPKPPPIWERYLTPAAAAADGRRRGRLAPGAATFARCYRALDVAVVGRDVGDACRWASA